MGRGRIPQKRGDQELTVQPCLIGMASWLNSQCIGAQGRFRGEGDTGSLQNHGLTGNCWEKRSFQKGLKVGKKEVQNNVRDSSWIQKLKKVKGVAWPVPRRSTSAGTEAGGQPSWGSCTWQPFYGLALLPIPSPDSGRVGTLQITSVTRRSWDLSKRAENSLF